MSAREWPVSVAVAAVMDGDDILLLRRPEGKSYAGLWSMPGGKVEPGEHLAQAAVREVEEETGVVARFVEYVGLVSEVLRDAQGERHHFLLHLCLLQATTRDIAHLPHEGEARWVPLAQARSLGAFIPSDLFIIERLVLSRERRYYECAVEYVDGKAVLKSFR